MKTLAFILLVSLSVGSGSMAQDAPTDSTALMHWLRGLLIEGRADMQLGAAAPRVQSETLDDGRTWLDFAVAELGTLSDNNWAVIDEAVSLLLEEAEAMKRLAASEDDPARAEAFRTARRGYLLAAASALEHFKVAAGGTFDQQTAGAGDEDWQLAGGVVIKEAAGSARLNTSDGSFSGRLSGDLLFPSFDTALAVPNFSFDSAGNVDLTAYGQAAFPPNEATQVTLLVPPRRPLNMHFDESGSYSIGGSTLLTLPDGNKFEGVFDIDDPRYVFGLEFTGSLTLELAKEITLLRPVITYDPDNPLTMEAIDGVGRFFGSLGKGLETFVGELPELPPIDGSTIGEPPEFEVPETVIPLDAVDAFFVAIGNDFLRPLINGPVDGAIQGLRGLLDGWEADVKRQRLDAQPTIDEIRRLRRLAEQLRKASEALKKAREAMVLGDEEAGELIGKAIKASEDAAFTNEDYLRQLPANTETRTGMAAVRGAIEARATAAQAGSTEEFDFSFVLPKYDQWQANELRNYGFRPDGGIDDNDKIQALTIDDLLFLLNVTYRFAGERQQLDPTLALPDLSAARAMAERLLPKLVDEYEKAVASDDRGARAFAAVRLLDLSNIHGSLDFDAGAPDLATAQTALVDTVNHVASRTSEKLAALLFKAARNLAKSRGSVIDRRVAELFGDPPGQPAPRQGVPAPLQPPTAGKNFLEKLGDHLDNPAITNKAGAEDAIRKLANGSLENFAERFEQAIGSEETQFEKSFEALCETVNTIAFLRSYLPQDGILIEEFKQTWEPFHLRWTLVAEAKKATWYLSAYMGELHAAASRFGGGLGPALEAAFRKAGTEAGAGLSQVVDFLAAVVQSVELEEFQIALPGDLEIQRFFGELEFNRLTGDWEVGFGGRAAFPDIDFTLDIPTATLASDGSFALSLLSDGEIPIGAGDDFTVDIDNAFSLTGNVLTPSIDSATAAARLVQPGSNGGPPTAFDATLNYNFLDPGHRFLFDANFAQQGELFSDDFVILSGGFGFNLETDGSGNVSQGGASADLTLGMIRRPGAESKPLDQLVANDFFLVFGGAASVQVDNVAGTVELSLDSGTLTLPPDIFSKAQPPGPPTITMDGRLCVSISLEDGGFSFCDDAGEPFRLSFDNIVAEIPGIEGSRLGIDAATLVASGGDLPYLENLDAVLELPLPGADNSFDLRLLGHNWTLDGLPELAVLTLEDNARVLDIDGFTLDILGAPQNPFQGTGDPNCDTSLELVSAEGVTTFTVRGGLRFALNENLLKKTDGTAFALETCGRFSWNGIDPPEFEVSTLELAGNLRLGGEDGFGIVGRQPPPLASVRLEGIQNLLDLSPSNTFRIILDGALDVPDIASFGLINTAFVFDGTGMAFQPGGFEVGLGEKTLELIDGLPVSVSELALEFVDPTQPLGGGLLAATNLRVRVSGGIHLPSRAAVEAGSPGISGQVQDLQVSFVRQPDGSVVPQFNTNGFGMQVQNLDIPPMMGLTGGLFVGNLNFPEDLYFVGELGATINDTGATVLLALDKDGVIGACFSLDTGPVGIPIDGGALGGLMLTGVKGGVHFDNGFADPCDFESFIRMQSVSGTMMPVNDGQRDVFTSTDPGGEPEPVTPRAWEHCLLDAGGGEFPVQTVNPLCMPHPTIADRVVYKGTILDASDLAALGITPATVPATVEDAVAFAAGQLRDAILNTADPFLELLDTPAGNPVRDFVVTKVEEVLAGFEDEAAAYLRAAIDEALADSGGATPTGASLYDAIEAAAALGVPCLDVTVRLEATLTHAAAPSVVKGTVGATLSTTGTVAFEGDITVSGIPMGEGDFVFQLTDTNGDVNPSFGGLARAGIGPLELGEMSFGYQCDGCSSTFFDAFSDMLAGGFGANDLSVRTGLLNLMDKVAPAGAPRDTSTAVTAHFAALSEPQKLAYLANVANLFILQTAGQTEPLEELFGPNHDALLDAFLESYIAFQTAVQINSNPVFCFEQEVEPKLFGFPLGVRSAAQLSYNARVHDPALGQDFQEFSAGFGFSPSAVAAQLLTGGVGNVVSPEIDFAEMSFAYRIPSWTEQRVRQSIEDPLGFAAQSTAEMMEDMVIAFGYELTPFGLEIGNGQGRVIMPRLATHPTRPGVNWSLPSGPGVASRHELILAALNRGRLKDASWRGGVGQLGEVFFETPNGLFTPTEGSCAGIVDQIAATLDREAMNGLAFANDFFPYGGLIGGAELSLPNWITELPPAEVLGLFAIPLNETDAQAWLDNATFVLENYLVGTTCAGQLAFYIPAPNPPLLDWDNATTDELMKAIAGNGDFAAVVDRTLPEGIYPFDQITFAGWLEAQLLGLPLGQAAVSFEPDPGRFLVTAGIPPDSWLADFLNADLEVELLSPKYLESGSSDVSSSDRLNAREAMLAGMDANAVLTTPNFVQETIDAVSATLPRASFHAGGSLQIPSELEQFIDTSGNVGVEVFGFSTGFEPGFETLNDDPYAIARRRGGVGVRGNFNIGYYPETGEAIEFNIDQASMALTPTADPSLLPAFSGKLDIGRTAIPFLPVIDSGELVLNSSPDNGFPYLAAELFMEPFFFGLGEGVQLLRFGSLNGPGQLIGGRFEARRQDGELLNTVVELSIEPMAASMPFLGPNVGITVYGDEPSPGEFTPFTFSTDSNTQWSATVCLSDPADPGLPPSLALCNPFDPTDTQCLVALAPNQPLCGRIYGRGLSEFTLEVTIPGGFDVTFFPGLENESTVSLAVLDEILLYVDHTGRFFIDLGDLDAELPGVISASGHVTFGYNPTGSFADVRANPTPVNFSPTDITESRTLSVALSNDGLADANVVLTARPPSDYTVNSAGFRLAPNQTNTVDVLFHPTKSGDRAGQLIVESNDPDTPVLVVPLNGIGTATPKYFQSLDAIAFGDTVVNGTAVSTVTVGNAGSAAMQVTGASTSNGVFSVEPTGAVTLEPGESQLYLVSFTPFSLGAANANLTIATATLGNQNIPLSGNGSTSRWLLIHDEESLGTDATLNDIIMYDAERGFVAGDGGTLLQTQDGGRSWSPRVVTTRDLNDIAISTGVTTPPIAEYHFEDIPSTAVYLDSSPNARHATQPTASRRPVLAYANGRFGSGLRFDGSNDYVDLTPISMPQDWSVSMWIDPASTANGQSFLAKHTSSGANQFILGFYNSGYHVRFNSSQTFQAGARTTGWQHLVLSADFNPGTNQTTITLYRNGAQLWSRPFTGATATAGGRPWTLGQEWDGNSTSDHFGGAMDEVYLYPTALTSGQVNALFNGGRRTVVVGDEGSVFESYSNGTAWNQHFDQRAAGWDRNFLTFHDEDWLGAGFTSNGTLMLAGVEDGSNRAMIIENLRDGTDFDSPTFTSGSGVGQSLRAVFGDNTGYSVGSRGVIYRSPGLSTWTQHGTLDVGPLNAGTMTALPGYAAVGNGGTLVNSTGGDPVRREPGRTSSHLRAIIYNDQLTESLQVVGDNGAYLTSTNLGDNWTLKADGLEGNNRGIAAIGNGADYEAWAVGGDAEIRFRPESAPDGPFATFAPGELDFGFRLVGETKTLPLRIFNRGTGVLSLTGIAISGAPFSIVQTGVPSVSPGDAVTVFVRYAPTIVSVSDLGELLLTTNEGGETFRVALKGRSSSRVWKPEPLGSGDAVRQVEFVNSTRGFAISHSESDGSAVHFSSDGGASWSTPFTIIDTGNNIMPAAGQRLDLVSLDAVEGSPFAGDPFVLAGKLVDGNGGLIRSVVIRWAPEFAPVILKEVTPPAGTGAAFVDVRMLHEDEPGRIAAASTNEVWQSDNNGASWRVASTRPPVGGTQPTVILPIYNELAVDNVQFSALWLANQNEIYTKTWPSTSWFRINPIGTTADPSLVFQPGQVIREFDAVDDPTLNFQVDRGWLVGDSGLYRQIEPQRPGASPFYPAANAEVFGTTDLTGVSFHDELEGWIVGETKIFYSDDTGRSWALNYDAGELADIRAVSSAAADKAWAGGSLNGSATIWRYQPGTPETGGLLAVNDVEILDPTQRDEVTVRSVLLENLGSTPIDIHTIGVRSEDPVGRFRVVPGTAPDSIPAGGSATVDVEFEARPEPQLCQDLEPEVFLRFEQGFTATEFVDDSVHKRSAVAAADPAARPRVTEGCHGRSRALRFDGNDYAEILDPQGELNTLGESYSFSVWVNLDNTSGNRAFFGKHSSTGGTNFILCGRFNGGYNFTVGQQNFDANTPAKEGWQHIAVTCRTEAGQTHATFYLDGEVLWQHTYSTTVTNIAGQPWILGADRDSGGRINDYLDGCLDEFAMFHRELSSGEIQCLANHSPLYGEHRATLEIASSAEGGLRTVDLRAEVVEQSDILVFETEPPGMTVTIDGVDHLTPVAFGVGSTSEGTKAWGEGSMHTIEVPDQIMMTDGDNQISYAFRGFNCTAQTSFAMPATRGGTANNRICANFVVSRVVDSTPDPAAPASPIPALTMSGDGDGLRQQVVDALANTPEGPFFRLTGGNLTIPGLGEDGFAIDGELFLSLTEMRASLRTSPLALPGGGGPQFLEMSESYWLLDYAAGDHFIIKAHPASLELLGIDLLPDTFFCIELNPGDDPLLGDYRFAVGLEDDYRPLPDILEFKAGLFAVGYDAGVFEMDWSGGVRVLKLPTGEFAIDEDFDMHFASPNINTGLKGFLTEAGVEVSDTLFEVGEFKLMWPDGDLRLVNDTAIRLELSNVDFVLLDQTIARMTASVGLDGVLELNGNINDAQLCLNANDPVCFTLKTPGGSGDFLLRLRVGLSPSLQLELPEMSLFAETAGGTPVAGWPASGIVIPALSFDSSVTFDTGKVPLPVLSFDGIDIASPEDGTLEGNHIRFQGGLERGIRFDIRSTLPPVLTCSPQELAFLIDNFAVGGSYSGNFCILPEVISIGYDPSDPEGFEFRSCAFGGHVYFGSAGADIGPGCP